VGPLRGATMAQLHTRMQQTGHANRRPGCVQTNAQQAGTVIKTRVLQLFTLLKPQRSTTNPRRAAPHCAEAGEGSAASAGSSNGGGGKGRFAMSHEGRAGGSRPHAPPAAPSPSAASSAGSGSRDGGGTGVADAAASVARRVGRALSLPLSLPPCVKRRERAGSGSLCSRSRSCERAGPSKGNPVAAN
jgi:hypothetical protein